MTTLSKKSSRDKKMILVTDSGLGGLSVFARIASDLAQASPWPDLDMIYFNAWPRADRGYNHFSTMDQRAGVFNNALYAMEEFKPDMILIACNTLSVIYPFTRFSRITDTQVIGIVDQGVDLIRESLITFPDSRAIIFGTPTTIREASHFNALVKSGISEDRLVAQACTDLAGKIERNPYHPELPEMVGRFADQALADQVLADQSLSGRGRKTGKTIFAALCCTHFGYCRDLFYTALSERFDGDVRILNPNETMAAGVTDFSKKEKRFAPAIHMKIISRVAWESGRISAYTKMLGEKFPDVVTALQTYELIPGLFDAEY